MNSGKMTVRNVCALIGAFALSLAAARVSDAAEVCGTSGANNPRICVDWNETGDPELDFDFTWDFSNPANPGVTFKTGSGTWVVWSQVDDEDDTPANLGDLKIDPTISTDDFDVTIAHGEIAGAANLGSAVLDAGNWTGYSSITGGGITGSLTGNLLVQPDNSPTPVGGDINLEIGGSVTGNITAYTITDLDIGDGMTGDINATTIIALDIDAPPVAPTVGLDGNIGNITEPTVKDHIIIAGDVTNNSHISINLLDKDAVLEVKKDVKWAVITVGNMATSSTNPPSIDLNTDGGSENTFSGRLLLTNGIPAYATVTIHGLTTRPGLHDPEVDLTNDTVAGTLELSQGGVADIKNGGAVSGTVTLAKSTGKSYTGQATFASVSSGGYVQTSTGADLDGQVTVSGSVAGDIYLQRGCSDANLLSNGGIDVGGSVTPFGKIEVEGYTASGTVIDVDGTLAGELNVGFYVAGDIELTTVTGSVDVWGNLSGDIDVSTELDCGVLTVHGDVVSGSDITVANMVTREPDPNCDGSEIVFEGGFDGDLTLSTGIPDSQEVSIEGWFGSNGTIDLTNDDVAGTLTLREGTGSILNGGAVTGTVTLADGTGRSSPGVAEFASVGGTGTIQTVSNADLTGDLTIDGSVSGTISIDRHLTSSGDIRIDGDVSGAISIGDDLDGDIYLGILGSTPDLLADGSISVGGALGTNGRIIVWGECVGDMIIADDTGTNSLIACYGGLHEEPGPPPDPGRIIINNGRGDYDHNGKIYVGQAYMTDPLAPVTFDGYIMITDDTSGNGGDNLGTIEILGCHDEEDVLDVCICGGDGSVTLTQDGCDYTATVECGGHCP